MLTMPNAKTARRMMPDFFMTYPFLYLLPNASFLPDQDKGCQPNLTSTIFRTYRPIMASMGQQRNVPLPHALKLKMSSFYSYHNDLYYDHMMRPEMRLTPEMSLTNAITPSQ